MSFLTDLATTLVSAFAKKDHNHDSTYEAKNSNIQTHISSTSNPHNVTKTQVGLTNVTDDKQVKANQSSVSGNVVTWSGTNGDALGGGYAVETTFAGDSGKLATAGAIKSYVDGQVTGINSGIVDGGTQSITTLRAIDTTDAQVYQDKILINVEDAGLYRLDRDSTATDDGVQTIAPTMGIGRWQKITSNLSSHNNTDNKQGGTAGEYYHITANQNGALPTGISSSNKLVAENNNKLSKLRSDGTFPVNDLYASELEWTAFETALGIVGEGD
jgi:hypothetical protein